MPTRLSIQQEKNLNQQNVPQQTPVVQAKQRPVQRNHPMPYTTKEGQKPPIQANQTPIQRAPVSDGSGGKKEKETPTPTSSNAANTPDQQTNTSEISVAAKEAATAIINVLDKGGDIFKDPEVIKAMHKLMPGNQQRHIGGNQQNNLTPGRAQEENKRAFKEMFEGHLQHRANRGFHRLERALLDIQSPQEEGIPFIGASASSQKDRTGMVSRHLIKLFEEQTEKKDKDKKDKDEKNKKGKQ